jgi:hypothetical protein
MNKGQINPNAFRLFKVTHFTEIVNEYVESLQKIENLKIKNQLNAIYSRNKQYKKELKNCLGNQFDSIFPELNSERIFLYMDLHDKLVYLDEKQLQDVIDSIEIVNE